MATQYGAAQPIDACDRYRNTHLAIHLKPLLLPSGLVQTRYPSLLRAALIDTRDTGPFIIDSRHQILSLLCGLASGEEACWQASVHGLRMVAARMD